MWYEESIFYQIYPLGLCDAPLANDGQLEHRILRILDWIPHFQTIGFNAVYFCPVFESDYHGYDTRDYTKLDTRLGTNADFSTLCNALHDANIKVVLDGVFNHVGRGFWAFQDVLNKRQESPYKDWFFIHFDGQSNYQDNLWYEGWEGHFELVRLNLKNPQVVQYLLTCVTKWIEEFQIDGLRLDVAYMLDEGFLTQLHNHCLALDPNFFLLGEMLHGDYNRIMNPNMLHSVTNYECYKGLHSSFNSKNMFEIAHSLQRQFGLDQWALYKDKHLVCFVDNHDVTRIATILQNRKHLIPLYGLLCAMPGIPCFYYGSEWGIEGDKAHGDHALRPAIPLPQTNEITDFLQKLFQIRKEHPALSYGTYRTVLLTNEYVVLERTFQGVRILIAINASDNSQEISLINESSGAFDLLYETKISFTNMTVLDAHSVYYFKLDI